MTSFKEFQERQPEIEADSLKAMALPLRARLFQGDRAGFPTRCGAAVIDVIVVSLIVFGCWLALRFFLIILNPTNSFTMPPFAWFILLGYLLMWINWTVAWATNGRSIGAWIMGVRVINRRGQPLSWPLAAMRSAFCIVFPFGLLWVIVSRENRSVQDIVLRTNVIYDWVVRLQLRSGSS